jgi:hypothetical protein
MGLKTSIRRLISLFPKHLFNLDLKVRYATIPSNPESVEDAKGV